MEVSVDIDFVVSCLRLILLYFGLPGLAILAVGFILWHFDKVLSLATFFGNLPSLVLGAGKKEALRRSIQNDINATILQLEKEVPELFDETVKIRWIKEGLDHANVRPGSIFIRVHTESDQDNVFINAVKYLLGRALLPEARRYIHGHIMRAIQLVLTERFLQHSRFRSAQALFRAERYDPVLAHDKAIAEPVNTLEFLEHQGLFTRVFLRECSALPEQIGHKHETSGPKWDLVSFLNYLDKFFRGLEIDRLVEDFEYSNNTFQVAFAVLAGTQKMRSQGLGFYKRRTQLSIMNGARTVYIIALGERNARLAAELAAWLQSKKLIRAYRLSKYTVSIWGDSLLAVCGVCLVSPNVQQIGTEESVEKLIVDDEDLQRILETIIPEIRTGEVQVVRTALLESEQALVVVHSSRPSVNAIGACVGHGGDRARAARTAAEMDIRFILWSTNVEKLITACLGVSNDDRITAVEIDPVLRLASIYTSSDELLKQLTGDRGTKQLAKGITEYEVDFQLDQIAMIRSIVEETVPEVSDGTILIEKIVRFSGIVTRVLVSSPYAYNPDGICAQHIREIAARTRALDAGRIYFSVKHDDPKETIISALYPVDRDDIVTVDLVGEEKARVVVNSARAQAQAVGKEGAYVKSASSIAGYWIEVEVEEAA